MVKRNIGAPVVGAYLVAWWGGVALLFAFITSNTAPEPPTLKWRDDVAYTATKLVAEIEQESADPDGDKISYTYSWSLNGEPVEGALAKSMQTNATLRDQTWEVTVRPDDGTNGGWGCSLPWRECAGDPSKDAKMSITVQNTPPRARVRFVGTDDKEPEKFLAGKTVKLALSCADADFVDKRRAELADYKAKGIPVPKPKEGEKPEDPCTYTIGWYKQIPPPETPEGEEPAEVEEPAEDVEPDWTEQTIPGGKLRKGDKWLVKVSANDGEIDGEFSEETIEIE